jgi:outer membrane protein assembly factor BamD (BamD/ComL family)
MMGNYEDAIKEYTLLIKKHPGTPFRIKSEFGIASSYEEMDELEKAYILYKNLKDKYPNPKVIETKMKHVLKRKISSKR